MKISTEWLGEYVAASESAAKLKDDFTMIGLLVETISESGGTPVLEVEVTSNRPDCLSHLGMAREAAALYGKPLILPAACPDLRAAEERVPYSIEIRDADLCPRYVGLVLGGVRIAPSPAWMQRRLIAVGMRPLNNIVDITNYVLLEYGHPLHAFDYDRLRGGRIVVARAAKQRTFRTLDGVDRTIDPDMLMIHDGEGPVAVAGVMGGGNSEIHEGTRCVLLECAYFQPSSIRRTSKKLGLSTEASYRFERGVDWDDAVQVIARTCRLIQELAGGRISGSLQDVYPAPVQPVRIELQRRRAEALLGVTLTDDFIETTLAKLGFRLVPAGTGAWHVECPSWRADMELEADLIEELARFYGYQNIPTTVPPARTAGLPSAVSVYESGTRDALRGLGYCEAVNLSFAGAAEASEFASFEPVERVEIRNPLTEDTGFLRTMLVPGLVRSVKRNFNHGTREVRLFELGKAFRKGEGDTPVERRVLGIAATGAKTGLNWRQPIGEFGFFDLKGVVSTLLRALRSAPFEIIPGLELPWLNPADASYLVVSGVRLGILGSLHPSVEEQYKFKQPVYVAEIDFEALVPHLFSQVRYEPLPKYPAADRDLCVVLPRTVTYAEISRGIRGLGIAELVGIDLIDVYEGEKIPAGKVSNTLRFVFVDREKTLTLDRVQGFSDSILAFLRDTFSAELR
jgi:phenylalanyl-tRNA synthetase beta chain